MTFIGNNTIRHIFSLLKSVLDKKADNDDIPKALPNPESITFTGAATGTYDGSKELTINLPDKSLSVTDDGSGNIVLSYKN